MRFEGLKTRLQHELRALYAHRWQILFIWLFCATAFVKRWFAWFLHQPYLRAVNIEPPITDEILLVEESSIRTQKAVLGQVITTKICTNMKSLALSFWISIVTLYVAITDETGFWGCGVYRVIFTRGARDGVGESIDWVFSFLGCDCSNETQNWNSKEIIKKLYKFFNVLVLICP